MTYLRAIPSFPLTEVLRCSIRSLDSDLGALVKAGLDPGSGLGGQDPASEDARREPTGQSPTASTALTLISMKSYF